MNEIIKIKFPKNINRIVAEYYNIDVKRIKSRSRKWGIIHPRQVAMYFLKKKTNLTLAEIGFELGGYTHATVINSIKKTEDLIFYNKKVKNEIRNIESRINALD